MTVKKTLSAVAIGTALVATPTISNSQTAPDPTVCETDAHFKDFDFWVGNWDVFNNADGQKVGGNQVERTDKNCFLYENWTSITGGTGHSMNYYNPVTGLWRQVWVSAGAYNIDYTGGLVDGSMVLKGTIYYYKQKTEFPFRGTWTPNSDGSVRQFFEQFNPETQTWNTWFDGKYIRAKAE